MVADLTLQRTAPPTHDIRASFRQGYLSRTANVQNHVTSYYGRELQSSMAAQCALCTIQKIRLKTYHHATAAI